MRAQRAIQKCLQLQRSLASGVARFSGRIKADKLIIALSRFSGPSVDAVLWKPPPMNDDESESDGGEEYVCPDATGERRCPHNKCHTQQRFEEAAPARSMFFEPTEVEMPEHQSTRGDRYVEPVGISLPDKGLLRGAYAAANALVQLQAHYHHCGVAASEKCLSAAAFVRWQSRDGDAAALAHVACPPRASPDPVHSGVPDHG